MFVYFLIITNYTSLLMSNINTQYIGKIFSGFRFKQIFGNNFYKVINENLIHKNYEYINGINICPQIFNPSYECSSGGLYFSTLNNIHM